MAKTPKTWKTRVREQVRTGGIVRARDLAHQGVSRTQIQRLTQEGLLERVGRGTYALGTRRISLNHSLAEVAVRVPKGVICLLSAIAFHRIGSHLPHQVWLALDRKAWRPRVEDLPLEIVRFSGPALTEGVETRLVDRVAVKIYGPAKTVADCFKYRNKIGLDVALEALREGWRGRRFTMDELIRYARVCRVARVMQPYLESLT